MREHIVDEEKTLVIIPPGEACFAHIYSPFRLDSRARPVHRLWFPVRRLLLDSRTSERLFTKDELVCCSSVYAPEVIPVDAEGNTSPELVDTLVRELARLDAQNLRKDSVFSRHEIRIKMWAKEWCTYSRYRNVNASGTSLRFDRVEIVVSGEGK